MAFHKLLDFSVRHVIPRVVLVFHEIDGLPRETCLFSKLCSRPTEQTSRRADLCGRRILRHQVLSLAVHLGTRDSDNLKRCQGAYKMLSMIVFFTIMLNKIPSANQLKENQAPSDSIFLALHMS
jgi:hypothetical protein